MNDIGCLVYAYYVPNLSSLGRAYPQYSSIDMQIVSCVTDFDHVGFPVLIATALHVSLTA